MGPSPAQLCGLSLLALTACGDSLVGGDWLDELMGVEELPTEVAWELRWFQGPGQPLLVECGLREPNTGLGTIGEVFFGYAEVPPPLVEEVPESSAIIEGDEISYGLALMVLMEPGTYDQADPDGESVDQDDSRGVWGVGEEHMVLVADGPDEALNRELLVEPVEGGLQSGVQLVGFVSEVVSGTGTFAGALYPLDEPEQEYLWYEGVSVLHLDRIDDHQWEVFEGVVVGGAERPTCDEEAR